jgi:predicted RNA-binding protein with PIN domain
VRWLVDAANVIGSRPDGWWRDREGAARRLIADLERFAEASGEPVTVVLDAGPPELAGRTGGVEVAIAVRRGRDAADDEIVRRLEAHGAPTDVRVVTSDRELARRARELGAAVEGAREFRARL